MEMFRGRSVVAVIPTDLELLSDFVFALDAFFGPTTYVQNSASLLSAWHSFRDAVYSEMDSLGFPSDCSFDSFVVYVAD